MTYKQALSLLPENLVRIKKTNEIRKVITIIDEKDGVAIVVEKQNSMDNNTGWFVYTNKEIDNI